jgi:hypothetical protein
LPALVDNINVWDSCLRVLKEEGYQLRLYSDDPEADLLDCHWIAEKDGYDLWASNPIELLGLAKLHQFKSPKKEIEPYWWGVEGEDIQDQLIDAKWPDNDE